MRDLVSFEKELDIGVYPNDNDRPLTSSKNESVMTASKLQQELSKVTVQKMDEKWPKIQAYLLSLCFAFLHFADFALFTN